jgi:SOS response associated peptidase (SRAP)
MHQAQLTAHRSGVIKSLCVAASPLLSSSVTFGFAGTWIAIYQSTRPALTLLPNKFPRRFPSLSDTRAGTIAGLCIGVLIPNWAQDPTIGNRMINARAESLTEKPAF